ncbi:hypothetical protein EKO27_g3205 [Xylaria grammica]|uniref:Uncharacterized protein n=1 Tax=Xylaria grammica TaxID=363999 RepID=A0A439DBX3_9PEZI|nr:hypothetical protein EKO27_g3205 [Xylaria grammica]
MDHHGSETATALTDAHGTQDGNSPSPTAPDPSLKTSDATSVSTAQTPRDQLCVSECCVSNTHKTPLQEPVRQQVDALEFPEGIDPVSLVLRFSPSSQTNDEKRSIRISLGRTNLGIIIVGTIASCVTVGFLIFLWAAQGPTSDGQHASYAWRSIMLSGRLPQLITISSVILRVAVGVQTTICTSLVAALILERRSIALSRVAPLSILRSVNSGPRVLIQQILGPRNSRRLLLHPEVLLLLFLTLGNIALQFSSTILFSDLQFRLLVNFPHEIQTGLLQRPDSGAIINRWTMPPHDYSLFGELYTGYSANPNSLGLSDTGVKRHAMLPFSKNERRTSLRSYRGPSYVLSSRVACMPPTVSGQVRFSNTTFSGSPSDRSYGYMIGKVLYEETLRSVDIVPLDTCDSDKCLSEDIYFDCAVPSIFAEAGGSLVNTFCMPNEYDKRYRSSEWRIDQDPWTPAAALVLVFSTNFDDDAWASLDNATVELPQSDVQEEWRSFNFGSNRFINMAICFRSMNVLRSNVSLVTENNLVEHDMGRSFTTADTESLRRFYGAEPDTQNLTERGVFTVKEIQDPDQISLQRETTSIIEEADSYEDSNTTLPGCDACNSDASSAVREYSRIFSDIIETTNRASVALQIVHTILVQSIHDQLLGYFTESLPVEIVETVTATVPVRGVGLIVVAVLVLGNITCIVAITTLYLVYSRYTLVDNFWHTISQTVSEETVDILCHSNRSKDKETSDRLKTMDYQVQLQSVAGTGEIKVAKANSNSDIPSILQWYRRGFQAVCGKR